MTSDLPTLYPRVLAVVGEVPRVTTMVNLDGSHRSFMQCDYIGPPALMHDKDAVSLLCAAVEDWLVERFAESTLGYELSIRQNSSECFYVALIHDQRFESVAPTKLEALLQVAEAVKGRQ